MAMPLSGCLIQRLLTKTSLSQVAVVVPCRGELSDLAYHRAADKSLDKLVEDLETYFDSVSSPDIDIQYSQGVVTVQLGNKGTYVINKQAPNKQLWLSSPVSGPFRYDYEEGEWVYKRDRHSMKWKLIEELTGLYQKQLKLH